MFGLSFVAACAPESGSEADFTPTVVQSEELDTVATVRWSTPSAGVSWIEFGEDESYGFSTAPTAASTEHEVVLAGLPVASTSHFRAVTEVDGVQLVSADLTLTTRPAPVDAPELALGLGASDRTDFIATTSLSAAPYGFVFDRRGRLVWYVAADSDDVILGELTLSRDGRSMLFSVFPIDHADDSSKIVRMSLDGVDRTDIPMAGGHHDFVELPEGGYAWLRIDVRDIGGEPTVGDTIVEADEAGNIVREVWNAWDALVNPTQIGTDDGFYPQGWDWLHGNSLNYDEATGVYLYSARATSTVYAVDRGTGETLWSAGDDGSLTLTAGSRFVGQHQPKLLADGNLLVFDNTGTMATSSVREYRLDTEQATYAEVWSYTTPEGQWAYLLGDCARLEDGATVVTGGTLGYVAEVDTAGEQTWRVDAAIGNILGFTEVLPHLGGTW